MRGLAAGEKGYEKFPKIFQKAFVFLNVYTNSVAEEHDPRGPEGPYRFKDRSVPVLVIKRWDGETLLQQLGFHRDPDQAKQALAKFVESALEDHGPVVPPKELQPLLKLWEKAAEAIEKGRPGRAWPDLAKIVEMGGDEKKFPEGPPTLAVRAGEKMTEILGQGRAALAQAKAQAEDDPKKARVALRALFKTWDGIDELEDAIRQALKELPDD